jgi:hypothetical protein
MKTISDYPLLIGEVLRRATVRQRKRSKWDRFLRQLSGGSFWVISADTCPYGTVSADTAGSADN